MWLLLYFPLLPVPEIILHKFFMTFETMYNNIKQDKINGTTGRVQGQDLAKDKLFNYKYFDSNHHM